MDDTGAKEELGPALYLESIEGDYTIRFECQELDSETSFRIIDNRTGEDVYGKDIKLISQLSLQSSRKQRAFQEVKSGKQREKNHPSKFSKDLVCNLATEKFALIPTQLWDSRFTEAPITGKARLRWVDEEIGFSGPTTQRKIPIISHAGWILEIQKTRVLEVGWRLGFAQWNDLEGIKSLVETLLDSENLPTRLALIDPDGAKELWRLSEEPTAREQLLEDARSREKAIWR